MKKLILSSILLTFSVSAFATPSVQELIENESLRKKTTKECTSLERQGKNVSKIKKCENVLEATFKLLDLKMQKLERESTR